MNYKYDVGLSFAGEDREYVEEVKEHLKVKEVKVFYDQDNKHDLAGQNLHDALFNIYGREARFVLAFISEHYKNSLWANHERQSAQARTYTTSGDLKNKDFLIPIILDDTPLDEVGILPTIAYLEGQPVNIAIDICKKLGKDINQIPDTSVPPPKNPNLIGNAKFDYSNHNGRFRIGQGNYIFTTRWNKASNKSIHCSISEDVRGISLAPKGAKLEDLKKTSKYNRTSNNRTPEIGRFVIMRNKNGIYAAIQIISIKDDKRGDNEDELEFKYWIQENGSDDFSSFT